MDEFRLKDLLRSGDFSQEGTYGCGPMIGVELLVQDDSHEVQIMVDPEDVLAYIVEKRLNVTTDGGPASYTNDPQEYFNTHHHTTIRQFLHDGGDFELVDEVPPQL